MKSGITIGTIVPKIGTIVPKTGTIVPKIGTILPKILALSVAPVLLISVLAAQVYGQARPSPMENVISVDPLPLAYDWPLTLQYELKDGPVYSWVFRLHYWPDPDASNTWSGFGVGAAYRVYVADSRALTGLSVAPAADLFFFRGSGVSEGRSAICGDLGGDLGYKWIFDDFAIEPIVGFRIGFALSVSPAGGPAPTRATGVEPLIGFSVGYAF